jgi:beta-glucosidase-like glycosyl hydrolase
LTIALSLHKVATAMNAGMDLYAGGGSNLYGDGHLEQAVETGLTSVAAVDDAVERILLHRFSLGLFDPQENEP